MVRKGDYTFINFQGTSVIDHFVLSPDLFQLGKLFLIDDYLADDHSSLILILQVWQGNNTETKFDPHNLLKDCRQKKYQIALLRCINLQFVLS